MTIRIYDKLCFAFVLRAAAPHKGSLKGGTDFKIMNNDKKVKYVKIGDEPAADKKKKKKRVRSLDVYEKPTVGQVVIKCLGIIGTTVSAMLLVVVIALCIIITSLALYVTQFAETDFDVSLEEAELSTSTFLYAYDSEGQEVQIKQLSTDKNRVLVDIKDIPQHVIDAFISAEDARYFEHDGVDWRRTVAVTVRMLISDSKEGGSTITQQLVRDITGDKEQTIGRKLREVFRALELEKKYSKDDILESYLNRIGFGGTSYGIASAALRYFDKSPAELTVAEAAILAGIIRSPSEYNPYTNLTKARTYQLRALKNMYEYGYITTKEYEDAVNEKVRFRLPVKGDDFGYVDERYNEYYGIQDENNINDDLYYENTSWEELGALDSEVYTPYKWNGDYEVDQNWYVDAAIDQIINDLAELRGVTKDAARTLFYNGGFKAYLNMDIELQDQLEELFKEPSLCLTNYPTSPVSDLPETAENEIATARSNLVQGSFVLMNHSGSVLALAGGLGEKEGNSCFNRATMDPQIIGSTVKPLSVYSLAIENNTVTYSTFLQDISGKLPASALGAGPFGPADGYDPEDDTVRWPHNYQDTTFGDGLYYPTWYAVQKSKNTMAVYVLSKVGLQKAYAQLSEKLHFKLDPVNDMAYSPLALGSITEGVTLTSLAAAYAMVGNGGLYYEPYLYSKVVDGEGRIVLSQNVVGDRVISSDTAYITNRLMRKVIVDDTGGTGANAQLENIEVVGKTGTANDESTLCFVGVTPSYVAAYRISRDNHKPITKSDGWRTIATVWGNVMKVLTEGDPPQAFIADPNVVVEEYCPRTGFLLSDKCKANDDFKGSEIGYYRKNGLPKVCDGENDHIASYFIEHYGNTELPFYG